MENLNKESDNFFLFFFSENNFFDLKHEYTTMSPWGNKVI